MAPGLPPDTSPAGGAHLMAPRLIELCFQTAGVLEIANRNVLGLPTAVRSVTAHRDPATAEGGRLFAIVQATGTPDGYDARVVDEAGNVYVEVEGYRTIALPGHATFGPAAGEPQQVPAAGEVATV
jgi:hypothetical protein